MPNVAVILPPAVAAIPTLECMDESIADAGDMQRLPLSGEGRQPTPPKKMQTSARRTNGVAMRCEHAAEARRK